MAFTQQNSSAPPHGHGVPHVRLPLVQADAEKAGPPGVADQAAMRALRWLRLVFGVCFAINLGLHLHPQYAAQFARQAADVAAQPHWLAVWDGAVWRVLSAAGVSKGLALLFGIEALLTVGLLTGWGFPAMGWLGLAYELLVWSALGGGVAGAAALVYALGFALLLLLRAWQGSAWSDAMLRRPGLLRVRWAFWLVGLLWAALAWMAWQPGLGLRLSDALIQAQIYAPGWQAEWIAFWAGLGHALGMGGFAKLIALVDTLIAAGLLLAPWLPCGLRRWLLRGGLIFSLLAWSLSGALGIFSGSQAGMLSAAAIGAWLFGLLLAAHPWLEAALLRVSTAPPERRRVGDAA